MSTGSFYQDKPLKENDSNDDICDSVSIEFSFQESTSSVTSSSSSSDMVEDATSSTTSSSSPSYGPLYELSDLMDQLPIKRGLSKHYQGKSQSFASLASVKSIEDFAKKGRPYKKKMKSCKSYGGVWMVRNTVLRLPYQRRLQGDLSFCLY